MTNEALSFLNGQFKAFEFVNSKLEKEFEFCLRNMKAPFRNFPLPFDETDIRNCFEIQMMVMQHQRLPNSEQDSPFSYRDADWNELTYALNHWLFRYMDDTSGHALKDEHEAFNISHNNHQYRASICVELVNQIKDITDADTVQFVNFETDQPSRFIGFIALFSALVAREKSEFYELRLGIAVG